jgi:hypothetical protein
MTLAVEREFDLPNERRRKPGQSEQARREGHAKPKARHMKPSAAKDEAGFTSSSGGVRALPVTRKQELGDEERFRNRSESNQVVQVSFEPG